MPTTPKDALSILEPKAKKLPAKAPASIAKNTYSMFLEAANAFTKTLDTADKHGPAQKDLTDFTTAQKSVTTLRTKINAAVDTQTQDLQQLKTNADNLDRTWDLLSNALKGKAGKEEQALQTAAGNFYQFAKQQAGNVKAADKV